MKKRKKGIQKVHKKNVKPIRIEHEVVKVVDLSEVTSYDGEDTLQLRIEVLREIGNGKFRARVYLNDVYKMTVCGPCPIEPAVSLWSVDTWMTDERYDSEDDAIAGVLKDLNRQIHNIDIRRGH